jgi:uncharacterized metal-binding protein YceD (DUF177 family)
MKFTILQLKKIQTFPYAFQFDLDFTESVKSVSDILGIHPVHVEGKLYRIDDETYRFIYRVQTTLVLQCALTLEPVDYPMDYCLDEVYSTNPKSDDVFLIEKNTIDFDQMVYESLITEKPLSVTRPDAYEILKKQGIELGIEPPLDIEEEVTSYSNGEEETPEDSSKTEKEV